MKTRILKLDHKVECTVLNSNKPGELQHQISRNTTIYKQILTDPFYALWLIHRTGKIACILRLVSVVGQYTCAHASTSAWYRSSPILGDMASSHTDHYLGIIHSMKVVPHYLRVRAPVPRGSAGECT